MSKSQKMLKLSEKHEHIIDCAVRYILRHPGKVLTNIAIMHSLVEWICNSTVNPEMSDSLHLCRRTHLLVHELIDTDTGEKTFLCVKCKAIHHTSQVYRPGNEVTLSE